MKTDETEQKGGRKSSREMRTAKLGDGLRDILRSPRQSGGQTQSGKDKSSRAESKSGERKAEELDWRNSDPNREHFFQTHRTRFE